MPGSIWSVFMKRHTSTTPPSSVSSGKLQKMAPGLTTASVQSDNFDVISTTSVLSSEDDYRNSLSDVVVVGAGPSGLMLAYVLQIGKERAIG